MIKRVYDPIEFYDFGFGHKKLGHTVGTADEPKYLQLGLTCSECNLTIKMGINILRSEMPKLIVWLLSSDDPEKLWLADRMIINYQGHQQRMAELLERVGAKCIQPHHENN